MKVRLIDSIVFTYLLPTVLFFLSPYIYIYIYVYSITEYVEKKAKEDEDVMEQQRPTTEFVEMEKPLLPTVVPQENIYDSLRTMSSSHGHPLSPGPSQNDERDYEIDEERNHLRELMMSVKGWVNVETFLCIILC